MTSEVEQVQVTEQESIEARRKKILEWMQKIVLLIVRIGLGYLFFTQLFWKMPPTFGCPDNFTFTTFSTQDNRLHRTSGLCDWIGIEQVWAQRPHPVFVANLDNQGSPEIFINIGLLAQINGAFIEAIVMPNIRWFGYLIWGAEAFIFVSLFFGIFTRLGGFVAIAMSAQLMVGLAGITSPYEWEWSYNQMVILALIMFAFAPGRFLGVDALLYPRIKKWADSGSQAGRAALWLVV